jgi:hypothetical protein
MSLIFPDRLGKVLVSLLLAGTSLLMLASCATAVSTKLTVTTTPAITTSSPVLSSIDAAPELLPAYESTTTVTPTTQSNTSPATIVEPYDFVRFKGIGPIGVFVGMQSIANLDFAALKQSLGQLWLPEYLPYGLRFQDTSLIQAQSLRVTYSIGNVILMITQTPCDVDLKYNKGSTEAISINGHPGYLVRGNWEGYPQYWSTRQLQIVLNIDGWIVVMSASSGASSSLQWTAGELTKVAESLKSY